MADFGLASVTDSNWIGIQKQVFTKWINIHLSKRGLAVSDIVRDFQDGGMLCNLLEVLSDRKIPMQWRPSPLSNKVQKIGNLTVAFQFIESEGIKLVNCRPEDICEGHEKLTLGLVWTLIVSYQIQSIVEEEEGGRKKTSKEILLNWVQRQLSAVNPRFTVKDFSASSWEDGILFNALVERLSPGKTHADTLKSENKTQNLTSAFEEAKELGIPSILDVETVANGKIDEQSVMTYLSLFPAVFDSKLGLNLTRKPAAARRQSAAPATKPAAAAANSNATCDPSKINVNWASLDGRLIGIPLSLHIKNTSENPLPDVSKFTAAVEHLANNAPLKNVKISSNRTGDITITFEPAESGEHSIDITALDQSIRGSPFKFTVKAPEAEASLLETGRPVYVPGMTRQVMDISGAGISKGEVAVESSFVIKGVDPSSKIVVKAGPKGKKIELPVNISHKGDNLSEVTYTPQEAGPHEIAISVNGKAVPGTPYFLNVNAAGIHAGSTEADWSGLDGHTVGDAITVKVTPYSRTKQNVPLGYNILSAKITNLATNAVLTAAVRDNRDGTHTATFMPQTAGEHSINVTLNNHSIKDSPHKFQVAERPGYSAKKAEAPASATQTVVPSVPLSSSAAVPTSINPTATSPRPGTQNLPANFNHFVFRVSGPGVGDQLQNTDCHFSIIPRAVSGGIAFADANLPLEVKIAHVGANGETTEVPITTADDPDGSKKVTYRATSPGTLQTTISAGGVVIDGCPFAIPVFDDLVDLSKTEVSGPGISQAEIGITTKFQFRTKNSNDMYLVSGGHPFVVKIDAEGHELPVIFNDNGDGTYVAAYTPVQAGPHNVNISLKEEFVKGCPFVVPVTGPDATLTSVEWTSAQGKCVDDLVSIKVKPKNSRGEVVSIAGSSLKASVQTTANEQEIPVQIVKHEDGTASVEFKPTEVGEHKIDILINENRVLGAPLKTHINASLKEADASRSEVSGLEKGEIGIESHFTIKSKNARNAETGIGEHPFKVQVSHVTSGGSTEDTPVTVHDRGDGIFDVKYTPSFAGPHTVAVTLHEKSVAASPYTVQIAGPLPQNTDVDQANIEGKYVGDEIKIRVLPRNSVGTIVPVDPAQLKAVVTHVKTGAVVATKIYQSSENEGTEAVPNISFLAEQVGNHTVEITLDGRPIKESLFKVNVLPSASDADASKSIVILPESGPKGEIGDPFTFIVQARNSEGNNITTGGHPFNALVLEKDSTGKTFEIHCKVVDLNNGTSSVAYTPNTSGAHEVQVFLANTPISGSHFNIGVIGPSADSTVANWDQLNSLTMDDVANVMVTPKNSKGDPVYVKGLQVTAKAVHVESGAESVANVAFGTGTANATFKPIKAGDHTFEILLDGHHIKGSPHKANVGHSASYVDPNQTVINWNGLDGKTVDDPLSVVLSCKNARGRSVPLGDAKVTLDINYNVGAGVSVPLNIVNSPDGSSVVAFRCNRSGEQYMSIFINGALVQGSPHTANLGSSLNEPDRMKTECEGEGVSKGEAGALALFTITAKNSQGNPIKKGGHTFVVNIESVADGQKVSSRADVFDQNDGTYLASYEPNVPGTYEVSVTLNDEHIKGSPFKAQMMDPEEEAARQAAASPAVAAPAPAETKSGEKDKEKKKDKKSKESKSKDKDKEKKKKELEDKDVKQKLAKVKGTKFRIFSLKTDLSSQKLR